MMPAFLWVLELNSDPQNCHLASLFWGLSLLALPIHNNVKSIFFDAFATTGLCLSPFSQATMSQIL